MIGDIVTKRPQRQEKLSLDGDHYIFFLKIGVLGVQLFRFLTHYIDLTAQIGLESTGENNDVRPCLSTSICMDNNITTATQTRLHYFYFEVVANKFYGRSHDLVDRFEICISLMTIYLLLCT